MDPLAGPGSLVARQNQTPALAEVMITEFWFFRERSQFGVLLVRCFVSFTPGPLMGVNRFPVAFVTEVVAGLDPLFLEPAELPELFLFRLGRPRCGIPP
jgi:hypothetical protein